MDNQSASILYSKVVPGGKFVVYDQCPPISFFEVKQVHSNLIVSPNLNESPCEIQADGLVIYKNQPAPRNLAIKTADCLPIYISGKYGHALIHAGWKGLAKKILIQSQLEKIEPEYAFIGPGILKCCYEVDDTFKENFNSEDSFSKKNHQLYFDLVEEASGQLQGHFPTIYLENCQICTHCNLNFHSFRRDQTINRNWNLFIVNVPNN